MTINPPNPIRKWRCFRCRPKLSLAPACWSSPFYLSPEFLALPESYPAEAFSFGSYVFLPGCSLSWTDFFGRYVNLYWFVLLPDKCFFLVGLDAIFLFFLSLALGATSFNYYFAPLLCGDDYWWSFNPAGYNFSGVFENCRTLKRIIAVNFSETFTTKTELLKVVASNQIIFFYQ